MKYLNKNYWKVGTNPLAYFERFFSQINIYDPGSFLKIKDTILSIDDGFENIKFNSRTTLGQILAAWEAFGFILKISNFNYIKIVDKNLNKDSLLKHSYISLFQDSKSIKVQKYRDSILWKCIQKMESDKDIINEFKLYKTRGEIQKEDLVEEFGKYEENFFKDDDFKKVIKIIYERNKQ